MSARTIAEVIAAVGAIALVALLLQPLARRLRIPDPLVFLVLGMVLGQSTVVRDAIGFDTLQVVGTVALVVILADGGLRCGLRELRKVIAPVAILGLPGTLVSFGLIAVLAHAVADLSWPAALILGAVLAPTDPAAVFSALAGQSARIGRIGRILEGEAGFNDPIAIALAAAFVAAAVDGEEPSVRGVATTMLREGVVGIVFGFIVARVLTRVLGPLRPTIPAAPALAILAGAAVAFGGAVLLHGSGYVAVYVFGLAAADRVIPERPQVIALHAELAHLGEVAMFVLLGVAVTRVDLGEAATAGIVLALAMIVVFRPLVAYPPLVALRYTRAEALFASVAGLRGAVPILLASLPAAAHVEGGNEILALTAITVVGSLVLQGVPLPRLAERLHLAEPP